MAKFYQKATVQATIINGLIGVIPAICIAFATTYIQIGLADKQYAQTERAAKQDSIQGIQDSILSARELRLNELQFKLAELKRKDEVDLGERMQAINTNQLAISKSELLILEQQHKIRAIENLAKFGLAVEKLSRIMDDSLGKIHSKGKLQMLRSLFVILSSEVKNPILLEDPKHLKEWYLAIEDVKGSLILAELFYDDEARDRYHENGAIYKMHLPEKPIGIFYLYKFYSSLITFYDKELNKYLHVKSGFSRVIDRIKGIYGVEEIKQL
jgi:hypothetical protein